MIGAAVLLILFLYIYMAMPRVDIDTVWDQKGFIFIYRTANNNIVAFMYRLYNSLRQSFFEIQKNL
jgi:hypothetical protein